MTVLDLLVLQVRHLLRVPFFVQQALLAPASFAALRSLAARGAGVPVSDAFWADVAVAGLWASTTTAVGLVGHQRRQGTLEHLVLSVRAPGLVFGSLCGGATALGIVGVLVGIAAHVVVRGTLPALTPTGAVGIVLVGAACTASSFALAALFVASRSAVVFEPLLLVPVWLLCGLVVPLSEFPGPLAALALVHPLTSAVLVLHTPEATGATVLAACCTLGVSAVWVLVARELLVAALTRAREDGTLALS